MAAPLGNKNHYKHGKYTSKTYTRSYTNILERCLNPTCKKYSYYGGKGITIAEEWLGTDGFSIFLQDMGEQPKNFVLHRKDKLLGYCRTNCMWVDKKEHAALHAHENATHLSKLFKGQHRSPLTEFKKGESKSPEFKEQCKQRMLQIWAKRRSICEA